MAGGVIKMENKHKGSQAREWLDAELKTPGFKEGLKQARARRLIAQQIYEAPSRSTR